MDYLRSLTREEAYQWFMDLLARPTDTELLAKLNNPNSGISNY